MDVISSGFLFQSKNKMPDIPKNTHNILQKRLKTHTVLYLSEGDVCCRCYLFMQ